jgi:hypothetical protein
MKKSLAILSITCIVEAVDVCTTHCKTYESHVPHKFTKMQSGPMTNVISPNIVKSRVL